MTGGLNLIAVVLVVMVGATILPYELGRARPDPVSLAATVTTPERSGRRPDIYFLVFDRYGSADSLKRRFGLDNDLYGWLEDRGFQVPSGQPRELPGDGLLAGGHAEHAVPRQPDRGGRARVG